MDTTIHQRTYDFAVRVIEVHKALLQRKTSTHKIIADQMLRSGTSVGAMVQEATSAESRADFIHKLNVAQKEARECLYWLRLIAESNLLARERLAEIQKEAHIIISILSSTVIQEKHKSRTQQNERLGKRNS